MRDRQNPAPLAGGRVAPRLSPGCAVMTPLDMALRYADCGWPVFPCQWQQGPARKRPLTPNGFHDAVTDSERINIWWQTWPDALIGVPTGRGSQLVILDVDVKKPDANGYD